MNLISEAALLNLF